MILLKRMLLIIGAALTGLILILQATSHLILLSRFAELDEKNTCQNVERILTALSSDLAALDSKASVWANWNDTYAFLRNSNTGYIHTNLTSQALLDRKINLILLVHSSGRIAFGKAFDLKKRKLTLIPKSLRQHLSPDGLLMQHPDKQNSRAGILMLPEGPILIVSRPVLTSEGTGPSLGTLIVGRYLDAAQIREIAAKPGLSLNLTRVDKSGIPPDFQARPFSWAGKAPVFIRPLDAHRIAGYGILRDLYGKPTLLLGVVGYRAIYQQGQSAVSYFILWFMAVCLGFGIGIQILVQKLILSRKQLLLYQYEQLQTEERYRAIMEQASEGILLVDVDTNHILETNPAFEHLTGYTRHELLEMPFDEIVATDPESIDLNIHKILTFKDQPQTGHEGHFISEQRYRRKDRSLVDVEVSSNLILYSGRMVMCAVVRDITERKEAEAKIHHQMRRLTALRNIDLAITSSLELGLILPLFLDEVVTQLQVDAADVLLYDPASDALDFAAGRGFRAEPLDFPSLATSLLRIGQAILKSRTLRPADMARDLRATSLPKEEGFAACYAAPLISKGEAKGVLQVLHRASLTCSREWLDFLEALAGQAAIAIDNATLYNDLERSNLELMQAYDATIEGWSIALELRDEATEGHTLRVTEMTLLLAETMGVSEEDRVHIRRGALLHDIGKMGIPDSILRKPGPLNEDEWESMRLHPVYAYRTLSTISFLTPALDIPYCHHEKWDGAGYPRGLKKEEIPLAARIFAVVDVWDALRFDRPYRKGWLEAEVREYLRSLSGIHFDPQIVEVFLQITAGTDAFSDIPTSEAA